MRYADARFLAILRGFTSAYLLELENKMTRILRVEKNHNFTTIDNRYVRDRRLSWQAKGLLVYIFTLPDDWKIYPDELRKHATNGISSTRAALKELREYGYLELRKCIDTKGRVSAWEYIIHEMPIKERKDTDIMLNSKNYPELENPHVEKPDVDKPHVEKRTLLNTNSTNNLLIQNTDNNKYSEIVKLYFDKCKSKNIIDPDFGERHGATIKKFLFKYGYDKFRVFLMRWFDEDIGAWAGYDIMKMQGNINKLQMPSKSSAPVRRDTIGGIGEMPSYANLPENEKF